MTSGLLVFPAGELGAVGAVVGANPFVGWPGMEVDGSGWSSGSAFGSKVVVVGGVVVVVVVGTVVVDVVVEVTTSEGNVFPA